MSENPIIAALAQALPKLEGAKRNANNPHFKSKYADLGSVIDALEPIVEHGLWYRQQTHDNDAGVMIETLYIHTSGQEKSAGLLFMPAAKRDPQGFGSALTYARRYGLQCAFGLATEDDDANAAVAGIQKQSERPRKQQMESVSPKTISDTDLVKVQSYCQALGGGRAVSAVLKNAGVDALDKIPSDMAQAAIEWLENQVARKAKAEQALSANDLPE